tara:strand:- start:1883 stop:2065 length:183 start_codon:yes stop_codon:yes gene_type:complete
MPTLTIQVTDSEFYEVLDLYETHMKRMDKIERTLRKVSSQLERLEDALEKKETEDDSEDH